MIPVETNSIWYLLGGVLAIALALEIFTGFLLSTVYVPDAGLAYGNIAAPARTPPAGPRVVNFHYYNAYLIFGLVMIHMVRVFITGGYRGGKEGLWLVGVGLAGLTFVISRPVRRSTGTRWASACRGTSRRSCRRSGSPTRQATRSTP